MKKLRWFAITLFLLSVVLYALDQKQIRRKTDQTIPKISMDQDEIQCRQCIGRGGGGTNLINLAVCGLTGTAN